MTHGSISMRGTYAFSFVFSLEERVIKYKAWSNSNFISVNDKGLILYRDLSVLRDGAVLQAQFSSKFDSLTCTTLFIIISYFVLTFVWPFNCRNKCLNGRKPHPKARYYNLGL